MTIKKKQKLVVFTGAGMSAESGLKTFRDNDGLWENHSVTEVATPEAWQSDKELVLRFYNMRRKQLLTVKPNRGHKLLASLEDLFEVEIITQNIDNLHERAGSTKVTHLHGELLKVKSERYPELVYDWEKESLNLGDYCEKGFQLRPDVVWFGEAVPMMDVAYSIAAEADLFVVIGTSLNVYPAANLVHACSSNISCYLIDPNRPDISLNSNWHFIESGASEGVGQLVKLLSN